MQLNLEASVMRVQQMNILVVTAHPLRDSLCTTLAAHTMDQLRSMGHDVVHEDLYGDGERL